MFENKIEFSAHEVYVNLKDEYPIPAQINLPQWFKTLEHKFLSRTIKGCMPFLDSMSAGYILKTPQDFYLHHNFTNEKGEKDTTFHCPMSKEPTLLEINFVNLNKQGPAEHHDPKQLKGSPHIKKNNNQSILKFLNPWRIKTPPGYSCLFVPPLNNSDDRFSILPGIVDTDSYSREVNFPFTINGDKYETLETTIKKGTPYVQVIPFKRDNWKMVIKGKKSKDLVKEQFEFAPLKLFHNYKNLNWKKKSWK
tara:strand:+ start:834 stop:1586 length:753 start_codon:yes stop_codon:yes gene_type:complete